MTREWGEDVWALLCGFEQVVRLLFILLSVFLLLTLVSLSIVDRDSGTYLIVLYNLVIFGGGLLATGVILRKCSLRGVQR